LSGNIGEAHDSLGYNFMFMGTYENGQLKTDNPCKIIPAEGRYLTRVTAGGLLHYAVCEVRGRELYFSDLSFIPAGTAATAWFMKAL
jgi:hypothetical protein